MKFPESKTKIVCTLGPASHNKKIIKKLALAGMKVARLNLAHDTIDYHRETLKYVRIVEKELGISIPVMMDIPGPKIRIGEIENGPIVLKKGQTIRLTTRNITGNESVIPVDYKALIKSVKQNSLIYLYDGFIQLRVKDIQEDKDEIICQVMTGGKLDSHKGLNLPHTKILLNPIREQDLKLIAFGLQEGVSIFGISFVEKADDIIKVKEFARKKGKKIFTVAKIEREEALKNIDEIIKVTDAIMVARGDLGVQVNIEEIPVIQKKLIAKANRMNRPVITATQMLVSMTDHIRPTRSEVTDVDLWASEFNLDPFLILAVIREESHFNRSSESRVGARGLMQIILSTGEWIAQKVNYPDYKPDLLFNPELNIHFGCWYLNYLKEKFNNNYFLISSGYNAGPGVTDRWIQQFNVDDIDSFVENIPYQETNDYIKKVMRAYRIYQIIYSKKDEVNIF